MISDQAIEVAKQAARSTGFSIRMDCSHLGESPISAGDYKGSSIIACVFSHIDNAKMYLGKCSQRLNALGSDLKTDLLMIPTASGYDMYVAIITGTDIVAVSEC